MSYYEIKRMSFFFYSLWLEASGYRNGVAWKTMHAICQNFMFSSGKSTLKFILSLRVSISQVRLMWCVCIGVLHGNFVVI